MPSNTELIKEKLNIVDFLRGYLTLQPAGKNFKANCPFHNEKTPSFMVSPDRQSWHCFGCGLGGDIFSFLMRQENIEFGDAIKILAEKAGIELRNVNPQEYKVSGLLYELNAAAKDFFKKELAASAVAQKYLAERGLAKETIGEFELGWAPNSPESLHLHLIGRNYRPEDILRAGLVFKNERGLQFDRFRGRIMFPIHNHLGKVVGFTGRVLPQLDTGTMGKYVNSPETPIFNKSKLLYGFWKTKNEIRTEKAAFLVEGQMDFLMSYQVGVKNVVATSGTALTVEHLGALGRLTDQVIVSFDNDEAGLAAGERAIDLAEANDFNVRVVVFKDAKDPADAATQDPTGFKNAILKAQPAPEFYFDRYLGGFPSSGAGDPRTRLAPAFRSNLRVVLGKIKTIASSVTRSLWLKELGVRTGIEEKALAEEMDRLEADQGTRRTRGEAEEAEAEKSQIISRRELLSQHLLAAALAANAWDAITECMPHLALGYAEAAELLKKGARRTEDARLDAIINLVVLLSGSVSESEIPELKKFLGQEYSKEKREALAAVVKQAESRGDEAALERALQELSTHLHYE